MQISVCFVLVGNTGDVDWMNCDPADDGRHDDVDLSVLNVQPEYHTGRPTYTCPQCSKQFLYASQLRQHMRFHLKHRPFQCPVCRKTFVQLSNLTEHFRVHSDERPFACELCERRFRQSSNLNYHVRTAHGQTDTALPSAAKPSLPKSFPCKHCGRSFAHACQLTNHVRSHTKDRPFQCRYCEKRFSHCSNLSEHERIHTGERPYVCATCSRSFAQSGQLKVHVKAHHPNANDGTLLVVCSVCGLRVNGLRALRSHLKQHNSADSKQSAKSQSAKRSSTKLRHDQQKSLPSFKHLTRCRKSVAERGVHQSVAVKCPYVCCHCEAAFENKSRLMIHLVLHEDNSCKLSQSAPSTAHQTNVKIKTEVGDDSESSTTDVDEPVKVEGAWSQLESTQKRRRSRRTSSRWLTCPYCSKQFAYRQRWKKHVERHKTEGSARSYDKGASSKKSVSRGSSLKTTRHSQRGTVELPDKDKETTAVKVENGNSVLCGGNDDMETALDSSSDRDDNAEDIDSVSTSSGQQRKASSASENTDKRLKNAVEMLTDTTPRTGGRKASQKKIKSPASRSRTYPCDECDRVMASAAALYYHRRTHSGYKPFACSQCPRKFIIRGQLVEHERIHSGEKPFACEHCSKRFAQSSQLRQHVSVHSEVGTHICPTCGEAFKRPWRLQSHRRAAHAEEIGSQKRYRCDDCGREYSLRQSWIYHCLTHSADRPFQCDVCSRQFRVAGQLRQHANHCRGRRLDKPAADPYQQPPQHWAWFSECSADVLAPTVGQASVTDVHTHTSMIDSSGGGETPLPLTEFQQL